MNRLLMIILASVVLLGSGCATVDPGRAQKLDLYRDGGPGPDPSVVESLMNLGQQNKGFGDEGYLVALSPGDEIKLQFRVSGEIAESREHESVPVVLKSPLWILAQKKRIYASRDGETFKPLKQVLSGSFSAGLNLKRGVSENLGIIGINVNFR